MQLFLIALYAGRFIVGLGVGCASMAMPMYVCESASVEQRGMLVTCINVAITLGQFLASLIGYGFGEITNGWRYMLGLAAIPAMGQFLGFFVLPESPRWLLEMDRIDRATHALRKLRGKVDVREELQEIIESLQSSREQDNNSHGLGSGGLDGDGNSINDDSYYYASENVRCCYCCCPSDEGEIVEGGGPERSSIGGRSHSNSGSVINEASFGNDHNNASVFNDLQPFILNRTPTNVSIGGGSVSSTSSVGVGKSGKHSPLSQGVGGVGGQLDEGSVNWTIRESMKATAQNNGTSNVTRQSTLRLLTKVTTARALLVGCALQAVQQIAAINTVMYYTATILSQSGFSDSAARGLSAGVSFCNFVGSLLGLFLVDRIGRRKLTLTSLGMVVLCLLLIGGAFLRAEMTSEKVDLDLGGECDAYKNCFDCAQAPNCGFCQEVKFPPPPLAYDSSMLSPLSSAATGSHSGGQSACILGDSSGPADPSICDKAAFYSQSGCPNQRTSVYLIFFSLCFYLLCFSPGLGTMPWTICSEIFPTNVRGVATSITTVFNWGFNFIVSSSFLTMMNTLSRQGTFLLYASVTFVIFCWLWVYLPETKDVSLEDIPILFTKNYFGKRQSPDDKCKRCLKSFLCCMKQDGEGEFSNRGIGRSGCDDGIKDVIQNTPYASLLGKLDGRVGVDGGERQRDRGRDGEREREGERERDMDWERERGTNNNIFIKGGGSSEGSGGSGIKVISGSQSFSPIKPTRRGQTKGNVTL